MFIKLMSAILSAVVYAIVLGTSFHSLFWFLFFFGISLAAYLIGGIACSILIDRLTHNHLLKGIYFFIAGSIVGMITIFFVNPPTEPLIHFTNLGSVATSLFGSIGALLFYIIELILKVIKR